MIKTTTSNLKRAIALVQLFLIPLCRIKMFQRSRAAKRARPRPDSPRPSSRYHHHRPNQPAVPGPVPPDYSGCKVNPREYVPGDMTGMSVEARENRYKDSLCIICTGEGPNCVYHTHFSTSDLRTFAIVYAKKEQFMCPICKTLEPVRPDELASRRVVLTTSTLYGIWDQPKLPDNVEPDLLKDKKCPGSRFCSQKCPGFYLKVEKP